ncbi:hypothetical protein [Streptomyces canus]|uniref:hypothetical protein n=1 Tax=Streptomyces canus TaxID=58343 RepID=UPI0026C9FD8D
MTRDAIARKFGIGTKEAAAAVRQLVAEALLGADDDPGGRQPGQVREQGRDLRATAAPPSPV